MSQRDTENAEVARWKKKFLDTLEVHDRREKSLINRIRLLRRGLVSVSLAGDGLDTDLDRELASLRTTLRAEESEAGIDHLLERIEKSVLRLDSRKEQSHYAIQSALNSSVKQLQELQLSRELKRAVKQYAKVLPTRVKDPQNHPQLLVDFLELLRMVVRELSFQAETDPGSPESSGFWGRLFGGTPKPEAAAPVEQDVEEPTAAAPAPHASAPSRALESASEDSDDETASPEPSSSKEPLPARIVNASGAAASSVMGSTPETDSENEEAVSDEGLAAEALEDTNRESATAQTQLEEPEAIPESSEPEPGFSAIANHAEPILIRILENIYVPEQTTPLAAKLRARISKGLNWYEFVSVLEDIHTLIIAAMEQERAEFQRFLNELNESLGQVQEYVEFSRDQESESRESERALDEAVRNQISDIAETVQVAEDISELKTTVQSQLSTIISSMDQFRAMKIQQQENSQEHARQLEERLKAMEAESRELRLHLAQQEQMASRDALTELPNRAAYDRRVLHESGLWRNALADGGGDGLCLAVCDVDHFKRINDTYGHLAGDKVLKILAKEISSNLRRNDFIARYGGEEFVLLMPSIPLEEAEMLINGIRQKIERCPFHFREKQVQITVSFGLTAFAESDTPEKAFERADKALYRAKEGGRNQVCLARVAGNGKSG